MASILQAWYPHLKLPIILQAPMRLVAGPNLAAQVTLFGGLGFLGCGYDLDNAPSLIDQLRSQLSLKEQDIGGNAGFILWGIECDRLADVIANGKLAGVWLFAPENRHSGFTDYIEAIRNKSPSVHIFVQVGCIHDALQAVEQGADAIVLQGIDAGGHGYTDNASIISLVPELADALASRSIEMPIIAAGGIADARGVAASLALGASAVAMGTAFAISKESEMSQEYKDFVIDQHDASQSTIKTRTFDILRGTDGWPLYITGRAIINDSIRDEQCDVDQSILKRKYREAIPTNDFSRLVAFSGTGAGLLNESQSASVILETTRQSARKILFNLAKSI